MSVTRPAAFGSFGAPAGDEPAGDDPPLPVPVLHVGEVHAELRLHITDETLSELGSQIATLIAQATREGFAAGMQEAFREDDFGDRPRDER